MVKKGNNWISAHECNIVFDDHYTLKGSIDYEDYMRGLSVSYYHQVKNRQGSRNEAESSRLFSLIVLSCNLYTDLFLAKST